MKDPKDTRNEILEAAGKALLGQLNRGAEAVGNLICKVDDTVDRLSAGKPARKAAPPQATTPSRKLQKAPAQQAPAEHPGNAGFSQDAADAIHRTYCKEDGFRFFAENLCHYTTVILPGETDIRRMWVDAYNSAIAPLTREVRRMEAQLAGWNVPWEQISNEALGRAMLRFAARAEEERLFTPEGWEADAYRAALLRYGEDLQQLLDAYPAPEG